eukprot:TRINITY_DN4641_c0_g1_i1.p1 TRINITY_DN4641_c0_g1~~TRINITY_DN4641_c0_g1_i1.p1  ORF type:complete len:150 (+),score=37.46 TRINITY_DN4641_c0_g1_i1:51-500(+)
MSFLLKHLTTKKEVDNAIQSTKGRVLVLRFGRDSDTNCLVLDDILAKAEAELARMAAIYLVDLDQVPIYTTYFDIALIPSTIFFYEGRHMKVDYNTQDHTKFVGSFASKQDLIDLVETVYRGAIHGKYIVPCPIDPSRIPRYQLLYKGI